MGCRAGRPAIAVFRDRTGRFVNEAISFTGPSEKGHSQQPVAAKPLFLPSAAPLSMEDLPAADAPIKVYENTYITKPNDNQR